MTQEGTENKSSKAYQLGIARPGQLITPEQVFKIRQLQIAYKLKGIDLNNQVLPPHSEHNPLDFPIMIPKEGDPILIYKQDKEALGRGTSGSVFRGVSVDSLGHYHAVKIQQFYLNINNKDTKVEDQKAQQKATFQAEDMMLQSLDRLVDAMESTTEGCWYTVQTLASGETLDKCNQDPEVNTIDMLMAVVDEISNLHQKNILHRDLKAANIFYSHQLNKAMLVDFGTAVRVKDDHRFEDKVNVGTLQYMAPETLLAPEEKAPLVFSDKSEVYSLGMMTFEFIANKSFSMNISSCFTNVSRYRDGLKADSTIEFMPNVALAVNSIKEDDLDEVTAAMVKLIRGMLQGDPDQRPTMAEIKSRLLEIKKMDEASEEALDDTIDESSRSRDEMASDASMRSTSVGKENRMDQVPNIPTVPSSLFCMPLNVESKSVSDKKPEEPNILNNEAILAELDRLLRAQIPEHPIQHDSHSTTPYKRMKMSSPGSDVLENFRSILVAIAQARTQSPVQTAGLIQVGRVMVNALNQCEVLPKESPLRKILIDASEKMANQLEKTPEHALATALKEELRSSVKNRQQSPS